MIKVYIDLYIYIFICIIIYLLWYIVYNSDVLLAHSNLYRRATYLSVFDGLFIFSEFNIALRSAQRLVHLTQGFGDLTIVLLDCCEARPIHFPFSIFQPSWSDFYQVERFHETHLNFSMVGSYSTCCFFPHGVERWVFRLRRGHLGESRCGHTQVALICFKHFYTRHVKPHFGMIRRTNLFHIFI